MNKLKLFILSVFSDKTELMLFLPLFGGLIFLLMERNISKWGFLLFHWNIQENLAKSMLDICGFFLWGIQGMIFAHKRESLLFGFSIKGKIAIISGLFFTLLCMYIVLFNIYLLISYFDFIIKN